MTDEFSVESVYAELLGRAPENKMEPRLAPLHRAMEILGEPNKAFPIIHVTGTNGKTSTARMIEAGLRAHGLSTGRYTSPHLSKVTERISIDGAPVPDETFVRIWDEIRPYLQIVDGELEAEGQPRLTYFECLTILGFAVFADQPVNVAVIEVGLGGITDATNVGDGQVSVVTPISLDHTDLLGDTTGDIAYEKAGIIKPGGFLISAAQPVDAAQVLLEKAKEVNVPFRFEGVEFGVESRTVAVGGQMVTIQGIAGRYEDLLVPLHGAHQAENAAVAIAALEAFFGGEKAIDAEILQEAFASVTSPGPARGGPHRADHHRGRRPQPGRHPGLRRGHPRGLQLHQARGGGRRAAGKGRRGDPPPAQGIPGRPRHRILLHAVQLAPRRPGRGPGRDSPWTSASARTTSTSPRSSMTPSNGPWNAPKPTTTSPAASW